MDVNEISQAVERQIELERCNYSSPPLEPQSKISESDLWKAVTSGEDGDAWLLAHIHRGQLVHDHAAGRWFEWLGHYWAEDLSEETIGRIDAVVDAYSEGASRAAWARLKAEKAGNKKKAYEAKEREDAYLGRIGKLQFLHRKRSVLTLAAAGKRSLGITGDEWDRDPWLLACPNGTIDLQTGKLRSGRQEDFLKTACPTMWMDLETKVPVWEPFLEDIFQGDHELIAYVQRLLGYSITGLSNQHAFFVLWGKGRNGKGTLLQTLADVLGPLAGPVKSEMLLEQRNSRSSAAPDSDIMGLRGKRLVWASESGEGRKLDAGKIKWLVGGDTLVGRPPYGRREISFDPTHTLFLLTNHKPKADPTDYALWQRIHLIPFTLSFVDEPHHENERQRDPYLADPLRAEGPRDSCLACPRVPGLAARRPEATGQGDGCD